MNRAHRQFLFALYLLGFLYTIHNTLPVYLDSSFAATLVGEKGVGIVFAAGALLSILAFIGMPTFLRRFGNYQITLWFLAAELLSLLVLTFAPSPLILLAAFVVRFVAVALIGFNFDIFLEHHSTNLKTGEIRGIFLSTANLAWVLGPIFASLVLGSGSFARIYLAGAILLLPTFLILSSHFKRFRDPEYRRPHLRTTLREIARDRNIWRTFLSGFLLQFFFAAMVIYSPIYLHDHVGLSWGAIGAIFSVMLLPFIILEAPLGRLADVRFGEKEIMAIGFTVIAIMTGIISFIGNANALLWAVILFATRVGAAMVEIMTETYFFKKVDAERVNVISLYRTMRPSAYLLAPLAATVFLTFLPFKYLFLALGLMMFLGIRLALGLQDTK